MSKTSRTLVTMPKVATQGEVLAIRVIVQHDMESGFRHTQQGERIARDIIREFVCTYNKHMNGADVHDQKRLQRFSIQTHVRFVLLYILLLTVLSYLNTC